MAKPPTLLVDGDIVLYQACLLSERDVRWDDTHHILQANHEEAWDIAERTMRSYSMALGSDNFVVALSGGDNFRKRLSDTYKRHRTRKPLGYFRLVERMESVYKCNKVETLEGDDLLGIWQTSGRFGDSILISADKDMQTTPGRLWRGPQTVDGKKVSRPVTMVSEASANYYWMLQTLTGDATDGYSGLPGCGKVSAAKILIDEPSVIEASGASYVDYMQAMWHRVVTAYEKKGLGVDDALLQARLARILRVEDWDSKLKEVKLWKPTK